MKSNTLMAPVLVILILVLGLFYACTEAVPGEAKHINKARILTIEGDTLIITGGGAQDVHLYLKKKDK